MTVRVRYKANGFERDLPKVNADFLVQTGAAVYVERKDALKSAKPTKSKSSSSAPKKPTPKKAK